VIIFTALLSVTFLQRVIKVPQWVGIGAVLVGLVVVGLNDFLFSPSDISLNAVITGDLLIVMAQIIASVQMVYEEKFVGKLDVNPLLVVGMEGFFGFIVLSLLSIPMYWINAGPQFGLQFPDYRLEDMPDAFPMMANSWQITAGMVGMVLSIAFFNWAGVSVTKQISATTRMVLDSCRTLIIWVVSLGLQWQTFGWLQVVGFVVLTIGIFIYNQILTKEMMVRLWDKITCRPDDEEQAIIEDDIIDKNVNVSIHGPATDVDLEASRRC